MTRIQSIAICLFAICAVAAGAVAVPAADSEQMVDAALATSGSTNDSSPGPTADVEVPWDYSPYRVLVWISSDDPMIDAGTLHDPLLDYLDRDFAAVWRTEIADAPTAVSSIAGRDIGKLNYDMITGADPVLAIKRDHQDAFRIRTASNVGEYCKSILATRQRMKDVVGQGTEHGNPTLKSVASRLSAVGGDEAALALKWADEQTEGLLVARGIANKLDDPEAKLIMPPVRGLTGQAFDAYDKIFVVHVRHDHYFGSVSVIEIDTLMRHFGPTAKESFSTTSTVPFAIGRAITRAFAPVVRIENAGQRSATGLLRASGLIVDEASPARVEIGEALEPMVRKNDRNGSPFVIGPMEWAALLATEEQGRYLKMDFYAGRVGSLQGRKNKRTFRMALKARRHADSTLLRLHRRNDPDFPLIGYELYERELTSKKMTFVGRTDWDGRLRIEKNERPLRLLYVKNGGAVLARLPLVPGLQTNVVADLLGDDMRLQAEAYVRGVQNEITDLVAIRELYKARIRLRLERGEMEEAKELMAGLRRQPTNEELSAAIGRKQIDFLGAIGKRNISQRRRIDEMFTTTRELLSKYVNPKLMREVEGYFTTARQNDGKLPAESGEADDQAAAASEDAEVSDSTEAKPAEENSASTSAAPAK